MAMNTTYLLTGGNVGNRIASLAAAEVLIQQQIGQVTKKSSIYETAAWGNLNQPDFLNQVLIIETALSAVECMQQIFLIENKMGRVRAEKNDPRIIDIDILFFNDDIINKPLVIVPHPQIEHRKFVLIPMNELSPSLIHPALHKSMRDLLRICPDELEVRLYDIS